MAVTGYDADKKAAERAKRIVTIGGTKFVPVKKTGEVIEELLGSETNAPDDPELMSADERRQFSITTMRSQYGQLALLLLDEEGNQADEEFLRKNLDLEDLAELMEILMPSAEREARFQ